MNLKSKNNKYLRVTLCAALLAPALNLTAASILLSADDFVILGGSAITSTGVAGTVVSNGNVGLGPTAESAITGFPPALVVNGSILSTGVVTNQARTDLILARTGLAGMASNANLTGQDLGGLTLAPGVYSFDSSAQLTGTVTLDAQNQDGAYWVFQIASAMTTAASSSVNVINVGPGGGDSYGIFWNAGSGITFGATNQIKGNYLAGTSITAGNATQGSGRLLALAGVTLDNNQINAIGGLNGGDWTGGLTYDVGGNVVPSVSEVPFGVDSTLGLAVLGVVGCLRLRRRRV